MSQNSDTPLDHNDTGHHTRMSALVCADIANSTALIERIGDARAAELIHAHDRIVRKLLSEHGGREVDKTDGFLLLFDRAIDAVGFAMAYQRELSGLGRDGDVLLRARVGIHVGEVVLWANAHEDVLRGAKPLEVEGLAKPIAARLCGLAEPGQTLLSEHTYQLARRAAGELTDESRVRWQAHGRYRFKGVSEPMPVFEVGEDELAPLRPPHSSDKAEREIPLWRQRRIVFVESLGVVLTVLAIGYGLLRESPALAFAERDWVVVGDLRNQTGESLFDGSLDVALRVGLEQSRYVNVVPDLQVADALRRMNLKGAPIDRRVGVELALREGARAFLLPSVTQVGGRTRFSVEVIDPRTGSTVYSESADSRSRDGILPSLDEVVAELRTRLGESLENIEAHSEPLEKVTTSNLEALKAYSLAIKALASGDPRSVITLLNRAVELDPQFATAYTKLASIWLSADEPDRMQTALDEAVANKERLTERERLYLEGIVASTQNPESMRERWTLLATLYPDFLIGQQNLAAVYYWFSEYRYAEALAQFEVLIGSRHPLRGISMQTAASTAIGLEQFAHAAQLLDQASALGASNLYDARVDLELAQRHYQRAFDALTADLSRENPQTLLWKSLRRIAVLADQGRAEAALGVIDSLQANPVISQRPLYVARLDLARIALLAQWQPEQLDQPLNTFVDRMFADMGVGRPAFTDSRPSMLLIAAVIAARADRTAIARRVRDTLAPRIQDPVMFERLALLDTLNIELARNGIGTDTPQQVAQTLFDRRTLYLRELALARRLALQDKPAAAALLTELCAKRNLAIAEPGAGFALLVVNVLASNRACVDAISAVGSAPSEPAEQARRILSAAWHDADSAWPNRPSATSELGR